MPFLKKDASAALVDLVNRIEERADACHLDLPILNIPSNVALWALLTGGVQMLETAGLGHDQHSKDYSNALVNAGRSLPIAIKWVTKHGHVPSTLPKRHWNPSLASSAIQALMLADQYSAFCACFPMWHQNRYLAEPVSDRLVRFIAPGGARDRQVSAHLKGFRPHVGEWKVEPPNPPQQTNRHRELFASVLGTSTKTGAIRFEYKDPWVLWSELLPDYQTRIAGITRRPDSISLGPYTLGQFKRVYSALLTICAVHDFLCFAWHRKFGSYPLDSGVMIRSVSGWVDTLSTLSGIPSNQCLAATSDLTFDFERSLDLHIHPFVPLDRSTRRLALIPKFPLHGLPDENILRVCSQLRPALFNVASTEKEPEMLAALQARSSRFHLQGPISLPPPTPDIDLVVSEEESATIVFAETKWIRKTSRPLEYQDRDSDVLKGISQLNQIRGFLADNPEYLLSRGILPRGLAEYQRIFYLLVARDHWLWIEPTEDVAIVEFLAFSDAIARGERLDTAIANLLTYNWLPVEGKDFTVRFDRSIVGGVGIESELFFASDRNA